MHERPTATPALLALSRAAAADDRGLAREICLACVAGSGTDGAAISLLTGSPARQTLWATDPTAQRLEDLQFSLNEGACMEAASTGRAVLAPDLRGGSRSSGWPTFASAVAEQTDVAALFALPLQWGAVNLGVLDLYRRTSGQMSPAQYKDVSDAVEIATLMMLGLRTEPDAHDWPDPTIASHAQIHQATGMVLAQLGVTATDALARLRAHAFAEQRPLIDVSRDVVARRLTFTEEMT